MSGGLELVSPEGLRVDGRKCHELRRIICKKGIFVQADGSAYVEQGNTKIVASVYGPHESANKSKAQHDSVAVNFQFSMATFSTNERKKRPKGDRKSKDVSAILQKTFETAIMKELYPRSQIDIYVQASQSDGACIAACVNAATLALIDAGVPLKDYVCASASSFNQENFLADINYLEEGSNAAKLTLAILPRSGKVVLFQLDSRLHIDRLENLIETGKRACQDIFTVLEQVIDGDSHEQATTLVV